MRVAGMMGGAGCTSPASGVLEDLVPGTAFQYLSFNTLRATKSGSKCFGAAVLCVSARKGQVLQLRQRCSFQVPHAFACTISTASILFLISSHPAYQILVRAGHTLTGVAVSRASSSLRFFHGRRFAPNSSQEARKVPRQPRRFVLGYRQRHRPCSCPCSEFGFCQLAAASVALRRGACHQRRLRQIFCDPNSKRTRRREHRCH